MKDRGVAMLAGAALVALALALGAWTGQAAPQPGGESRRTVSVTGEAEVRAVPDEVVVTLGIATHNPALTAAKQENDAILQRVLGLVERLEIPPEHIQTDYIGISPRYPNGCYELCDPIGYNVQRNVAITLRDLSRFEELLAGVLDAGVNYVHGIEFRTTQLRKYRDEARALAIRAAREKAAALVGELGEEAGRPLSIQEQQSAWWSGYSAWWGGRWGSAMTQNTVVEYGGQALGSDSSVAPGQISIRASVAVSFEMKE